MGGGVRAPALGPLTERHHHAGTHASLDARSGHRCRMRRRASARRRRPGDRRTDDRPGARRPVRRAGPDQPAGGLPAVAGGARAGRGRPHARPVRRRVARGPAVPGRLVHGVCGRRRVHAAGLRPAGEQLHRHRVHRAARGRDSPPPPTTRWTGWRRCKPTPAASASSPDAAADANSTGLAINAIIAAGEDPATWNGHDAFAGLGALQADCSFAEARSRRLHPGVLARQTASPTRSRPRGR